HRELDARWHLLARLARLRAKLGDALRQDGGAGAVVRTRRVRLTFIAGPVSARWARGLAHIGDVGLSGLGGPRIRLG
ncbi:MAG: hypothetical protein ACI9WU_001891, partial [Myxococcota bacterium]